MSDFKQEERYIVVKLKDVDAEETEALREFLHSWQIPTRECVVVEPDWPNYKDTWRAVEDAAKGEYVSPYARIAELEQQKQLLVEDRARFPDRPTEIQSMISENINNRKRQLAQAQQDIQRFKLALIKTSRLFNELLEAATIHIEQPEIRRLKEDAFTRLVHQIKAAKEKERE